jgi:RPA family protein
VNYKGTTPETVQNGAYLYSLNGKTEGGGGGDTPTPTGDYGTKEAPLTVAKALEIINGLEDNGTVSPAFVKGKISKIQSFNDKYKSITYYISDDGTDNNSLQVYSGKGLDGTDFAAQTDLETGWTVVVTGELKKYVNANTGAVTLEINQSSQIVSIDKTTGGGGDTPSSDLGTKDAPITVAKALEAINAMDDSGETETEAFVKGKISKVQSFNDKFKSITYYISDDGTDANALQVYSGKGIDGADFAAATDLEKGWTVIVTGELKKYVNSNTGAVTPEINQSSKIVSIDKSTGGGGGDTPPSGDAQAVTIAQFNAAAVSNDVWYQLTGTISNLKDGDKYGNFDLTDETGSVYVYGLLSEKGGAKQKFQDLVTAKGVANGKKITIIGNRGKYQDKIEVVNAYFVSIE